jgi:phosphatidylglycerophosphate synthase
LQGEALAALLCGGALLGVGLWTLAFVFALPVQGALQAAGLYALVSAGVWCALPLHLPHQRFGPANEITLLRAVLVSLLAGLAGWVELQSLGWLAFLLALTILVLDGVDGWAARRSGLRSPFGERFDIEVDSLLLLTICLLLAFSGKAGVWVLGAALLRYAFVAGGKALPWLAWPLPPSWARKTCFVIAAALLFAGLAPVVPPALTAAMASTATVLLVASFAVDLVWLTREARRGPA